MPSHSGTSMLLLPAHLQVAVVALEGYHAQCDQLLASLPLQDLYDLAHLLGPSLSDLSTLSVPLSLWFDITLRRALEQKAQKDSLCDAPPMCGRPLLLRANWLAGDKETKHFIESSVEMLWQSTQGDGTMFEDVEPHRPCMSLSCCIT